MRVFRGRICRACFGVLLAVGVGFLFLGFAVIPILPYFQLDAVLSPGELADPRRYAETLALLKKAAGNQWLFWVVGGVVVIVISGIGLLAVFGLEHDERRGPRGG